MNPMEKHKKTMNKTSENTKYLIGIKIMIYQHNKLHLLTARRGKWISEKMYRDIEQIIQRPSHKYITSEGKGNLSNQKWTNFDIEYDQFCCSYCDKSLCLQIKKKMSALAKLYNLVKTLSMNDDNKENCCGISNDFIRKLMDCFS